jgi:hypothetical protein
MHKLSWLAANRPARREPLRAQRSALLAFWCVEVASHVAFEELATEVGTALDHGVKPLAPP